MFVILSVIYRPVEQLLSRMIADRRARGLEGHPLRVPALIQGGFALAFLVAALALRPQIENDLFGGSSALYWILVVGVLAYAASYFARGWLAGHQRFALYGGLVFLESTSRFMFALAVAVGIGSGVGVVGLGMAVAPFVSLLVMPFAFSRVRHPAPRDIPVADAAREGPAHAAIEEASADVSLKHGTGFAVAVVGIMLAEQTLMNAAVLIVNHTSGVALAGFVFNVLLIVRAPLQLFQAIQTSILPHLAGLEARESAAEFHRAIRLTVTAIAGFAICLRDRAARHRTVRDDGPARRQGLPLRAGRARGGRGRDGAAPRRRDPQPGRAGPRPGPSRRGLLADGRGAVRAVRRAADDQRRSDPGRGRLLPRRARARRTAVHRLSARAGGGRRVVKGDGGGSERGCGCRFRRCRFRRCRGRAGPSRPERRATSRSRRVSGPRGRPARSDLRLSVGRRSRSPAALAARRGRPASS